MRRWWEWKTHSPGVSLPPRPQIHALLVARGLGTTSPTPVSWPLLSFLQGSLHASGKMTFQRQSEGIAALIKLAMAPTASGQRQLLSPEDV